jgi:peptide deformylase
MAVLEIAQIGHPALRLRAREVSPEELRSESCQSFIDDLLETMRHANGAGLAATQVMTPLRICAVEVRPNNPRYPYKPAIPLHVLVNPELRPLTTETFVNFEGCLSVPNLRGRVQRFRGVELRYLDRHGEPHQEQVWGLSAGTYQHECDHLDGVVFIDRVEDKTSFCTWDHFRTYFEAGFVQGLRDAGLIDT